MIKKNKQINLVIDSRTTIVCELRTHNRAKSLKVVIGRDGMVVATKPKYVSYRVLQKFVESKAQWIADQLEKITSGNKVISPQKSLDHYRKHKKDSRQFIEKKLVYFNQFYGFDYNKISIRNQRTRWGSCSAKANLNFSYRVYLLPEKLADYIIVHELCHLKEMNHSLRFWRLVSQTIPNYKARRKDLKDYKFSLC